MGRLDIVVPCFNEKEVLPETCSRLVALLQRLIESHKISPGSKICFIDDGSTDETWKLIEQLSAENPLVSGVKLSRNRGHQNALIAGLFTVTGDVVVSIDADLQDDIDSIELMIDKFNSGVDIVYGVRGERPTDSVFKRTTAKLFYKLMAILGTELVFNHADYRLMSRRAIESLKQYPEVNLFLRGIVPLLGFKSDVVTYTRSERFAGESKYPLKKMLVFAIEGITSFSIVPLRLITLLGFLVFTGSMLVAAWVLWAKFFTDGTIPGWASIVLPMSFLGGVQILCTGILGEYLGKVYAETKSRPRFFIDKYIDDELQNIVE